MKYDKELLAYLLQKYCHDHDEDRCEAKVGLIKKIVHNHIGEFLSSKGMSLFDIERFMSLEDRLLHLDKLKKLGKYEFHYEWFSFLDDGFLANHAKEALAATQSLSVQKRIANLMSTREILDNIPLFTDIISTDLIYILKKNEASHDDYVELLIKFYENHWGGRGSFLEQIRWGVEDVAECTQLNVKTLMEDILCHYMDDIKVIGNVINHHDDWKKLGVDYKEYVDQYIKLLQKRYRVNGAFVKDFIDRFGYYYFGDNDSADKAIRRSGEINTILSKIPLYELKRNLDKMESCRLSSFLRKIEEAGGDIGIIEKRLRKCKSFMYLRSKADIEIAWTLLEFGRKIFDDKTLYEANIRLCHFFPDWRWRYIHSK